MKVNLNQLTSEGLTELEQLADHSLFECRNCGNERTSIKCFQSKKLAELEREEDNFANLQQELSKSQTKIQQLKEQIKELEQQQLQAQIQLPPKSSQ